MDPVAFARFLGLDAILHGQQGVIRRDQALAAGVASTRIDDLVRRGVWVRILPRVFAVDVDSRHPRVRIRATWLWAGDTAVIAGGRPRSGGDSQRLRRMSSLLSYGLPRAGRSGLGCG